MPEADKVFRVLCLALDAAASLLGEHGLKACAHHALDNACGWDVSVAAAAATVGLSGEGARGVLANLIDSQRSE